MVLSILDGIFYLSILYILYLLKDKLKFNVLVVKHVKSSKISER